MKYPVRSLAGALLPLAILAALLWMPAAAAGGARSGLSVCAGVIVPSLFPFLLVSAMLRAQGIPEALARISGPLLKVFGLPPAAAAPFLLGLCGGYPVGANAVAELVRAGDLTPEEGARLLPVCNNTGPGFIVGVAGSAVFGSVRAGLLLYLCHILAALTLALLSGRKRPPHSSSPAKAPAPAGLGAFPSCVSNAARTTLDICGYVVFFSMLTAIFTALGVFSALAGALARSLHTELRLVNAMLTGLLELGGGVAALRGVSVSPAGLAVAAFLLGFGGLSVHAQTLYAVSGTKIGCARHFAGRILHGLLSAVYVLLLTHLQI